MMSKAKIALLLLIVSFATLHANASQHDIAGDSAVIERPVTSSYSLEWGSTTIVDTYLSPLKYNGQSLSLAGSWLKAMRQNPQRLIMSFDASIHASQALSPAKNSRLYEMGIGFSWSMLHRWRPIDGLQLAAGGSTMLDVGAIYLARNSNNPVSAQASIDIALAGMASYTFKIGKLPIKVSDRLSLPIVGAFFSPDYGETYYEIYLGNHSGLAHYGWWGNHFRIDNLLSADISLGSVALRLGYRMNIKSSFVNNINTRINSHALVVGLTSDWLNVTTPKEKTISIPAIY